MQELSNVSPKNNTNVLIRCFFIVLMLRRDVLHMV